MQLSILVLYWAKYKIGESYEAIIKLKVQEATLGFKETLSFDYYMQLLAEVDIPRKKDCVLQ